ncbi:MAG: BatD family protein [Bacteroidota bacterium]
MKPLLLGWLSLLLLLPAGLVGQKARAYVPKKVITTDDILPLYIEIQGPPLSQSPTFPNIWGMKKLGMNREQKEGVTLYVQTYQPIRSGMFQIPSIQVNVGRTTTQTFGITVRVDKGKLPLPSELAAGRNLNRKIEAFLTFDLSKKQCLVGEQVRSEVKLWVPREQLNRYQWDQQELMALSGQLAQENLWIENHWPLPERPEETVQNGRAYATFLLYKGFLFPRLDKTFQLGGGEVFIERLLTHRQGNRPARYEQIQLSLPTRQLTVEALPTTNMSKAESVGKFSLEYHLPKSSFLTGETIPLTLSVLGDGNIAMIPQPQFQEPAQFLLYDPSSSYEVQTELPVMTGGKEFAYELVPAFQGTYAVGPISFYYFDPARRQYDSVRIESISLVIKGEDIPQLLEVDALNNFYRDAFAIGDEQAPFRFPYATYLVITCLCIALGIVGWNLTRIFRKERKRPSRTGL